MKYLFYSLITISVIALSCTKDKNDSTTTKTTEELLTQKTWKADEVRVQLSNNTTVYYKRGVSGSLYDTDSIKFNTNNTGVYFYTGTQYTTTWNFTSSDKSKMTLVINYPTPVTIYLENVQVTNEFLRYAQYESAGGTSYLGAVTRLPN